MTDPPLAARVADNLRRVVRTLEESTRLISLSIRNRERRLRERSPNMAHRSADAVVWSSPSQDLVCRLIARTTFAHEVELIVDGQVRVTRVFNDPVEAADEASRLRRLFLDTDQRFTSRCRERPGA
jgi:hypothetical protein